MVQENIHQLLPTLPPLRSITQEPKGRSRKRIHLQEMWSRLLCRNRQRKIFMESLLLKEAMNGLQHNSTNNHRSNNTNHPIPSAKIPK